MTELNAINSEDKLVNFNFTFNYNNASPGSYKTTQATAVADKFARGANATIIMAAPTTDLLRQTLNHDNFHKARLENLIVDAWKEPATTDGYRNVPSYLKDIIERDTKGKIILTTHASLFNMPDYLKERCHLIIDETFDPYFFSEIAIDPCKEAHHKEVISLFQPSFDEGDYFTVSWTQQFERLYRNKYNDIFWGSNRLTEFLRKLRNPHWHFEIERKQWESFCLGDTNTLKLYGTLNPTILKDFKEVHILSSDFLSSKLYDYWQSIGVNFEPSERIKPLSKPIDSSLITIEYLTERSNSKYLQLNTTKAGGLVRSAIEAAYKHWAQDVGEHVLVTNIDWAKTIDIAANGIPMPVASHGSNEYLKYHNMALFPALNLTPEVDRYLCQRLRLDRRRSYYTQVLTTYFQDIMRLSIRDRAIGHEIRVLVVSRRDAELLQRERFPNCRISPSKYMIDDELRELGRPGRKPTDRAMTSTERSRKHRSCNGNTRNKIIKGISVASPNNITLFTSPSKSLQKQFTISSQNGEITTTHYDRAFEFDIDEVQINGIREFSELLVFLETMPDTCIIRGEPKDSTKTTAIRRQLENFQSKQQQNWIMLDFDKVPNPNNLRGPEAIEYLIRKLPLYLHNVSYHYQWSSSAGVFGNDTLSAHIYMWLAESRTDAQCNAWAKDIGVVDPKVMHPIQIHYTAAPAFHNMLDPMGERRSGLIIKDIEAAHIPIIEEVYNPVFYQPSINVNWEWIEKRKGEVLTCQDGLNHEFFRFAMTLKHNGVEPAEAKILLTNLAHQVRDTAKRLKQIDDIMKAKY